MSVFWLLVAAMTALALFFIVPPVLRSKTVRQLDHDLITTEVIKEQLAELANDLEAGKLDKAAYTAARHDLERSLLDDLDMSSDARDTTARSGRWASLVLAFVVPAVALWLYHQLGSQAALSTDPSAVATATTDQSGHSLETMIKKLAIRLQENPDDVEGWMMLATSYAATNQFDKAADTYKELLKRTGEHPQILTDYADALAMANGGTFTEEVGILLQTALELQPDNIKALWLMGHWHYQRSEFSDSLEYWQKASTLLPADSKDAVALNQQIQVARNKLGGSAAEATPAEQEKPAVTVKTGIQVSVTIDPTLEEKTSPEDTLFIFARATKGPRMPLAIVRKQVKDLPLTVTLDDSQAMSPQMVLSNFPEVSVGARISKTGNAMPSSGDLKGEQSPVAIGQDKDVAITISEVIP